MVTWPRPPPSPAPSRKTQSVQLGQRQCGKASTTKESNANLSEPDHGEGPEHGSGRRDGGYRRGQAKRGTHNGDYAAETQSDGQQLRSAHPLSQQRAGKQHHEDRSASSESRGVAQGNPAGSQRVEGTDRGQGSINAPVPRRSLVAHPKWASSNPPHSSRHDGPDHRAAAIS